MKKNHIPISFEEAKLKCSPGSHQLVVWKCPNCACSFTKTFKQAIKTQYCKPCGNKINASERMSWIRERGNPMAGKAPFKGETPRCSDCGIAVSSRTTRRCSQCMGVNKTKNKQSKETYRFVRNKSRNKRISMDLQFKISERLRSRLHKAIRNGAKRGSAVRDLGCTIEELRVYLESLFQPGMTWENWSYEGWHIDHKRSLASFDLTDRIQFLEAVHFTNLQPMWAKDNMKKGAT